VSFLALVSHEVRAAFARKAARHSLDITFIEAAQELTALAHAGMKFSVAILPATPPDSGFWSLWGQLQLLNPRPEILIYSRHADFGTWSGVLEAGGHDILVEPFSAEELCNAVIKAEKAFRQRLAAELPDELA
jgi:DNA-binding NtrC family response regulator